MSGRTNMTDKEKKQTAMNVMLAITSALALPPESGNLQAIDHKLEDASKGKIFAVQFILIGSGMATSKLNVDGDYGKQTLLSIVETEKAANLQVEE